jgi:hypothetical protein
VDDLQFVAIGELRRCPLISRDQFPIALDGNAIGFHAELDKKIRKARNRTKFTILAVDGEFHLRMLIASGRPMIH